MNHYTLKECRNAAYAVRPDGLRALFHHAGDFGITWMNQNGQLVDDQQFVVEHWELRFFSDVWEEGYRAGINHQELSEAEYPKVQRPDDNPWQED